MGRRCLSVILFCYLIFNYGRIYNWKGVGHIEAITEHSCEQESVFINTMRDLREMVQLEEQSSFKIWFFILIFTTLALVVSGIIQVLITTALEKVKKKKSIPKGGKKKGANDEEPSGEDSEEEDPKKKAGKKDVKVAKSSSIKSKLDKKLEAEVVPTKERAGTVAKKPAKK